MDSKINDPVLEPLDVSQLTLSDVDTIDSQALQRALRSVIRNEPSTVAHKDHRSHSNVC